MYSIKYWLQRHRTLVWGRRDVTLVFLFRNRFSFKIWVGHASELRVTSLDDECDRQSSNLWCRYVGRWQGVISTSTSTCVYSLFTVRKVCLEITQMSANWKYNFLWSFNYMTFVMVMCGLDLINRLLIEGRNDYFWNVLVEIFLKEVLQFKQIYSFKIQKSWDQEI